MKKFVNFVMVFFIVLLLSSCKKDDNPVTTNNTGGGTVTSSWVSLKKTGLNIPINNGYTYDTIDANISSPNFTKNVNLLLDSITGVDVSKLKFDLIRSGHTIRVIDSIDKPGTDFIGTVLSDSSTNPIRYAQPPYTGIFQPDNPFSVLRDIPPEGPYILRIFNSGNIRTGVIKSWGITVTYTPTQSNYCLEFDGTSQYANTQSNTSINSILTNRTFTLEGWYKVLGYTSYYFSFLDKQNSWYFEYSRRDTAWTLVASGSNTAKSDKFIIQNDTWYHIAVTFDGATNTSKFYANGILIGTQTVALNFLTPNSNPLYIARGISGANEYGMGRYDEVRIWNIVRTDAEIFDNYKKSLTGNENGIVLYYKFNEGNGDVINDASPNQNNGTLFNRPVWSTDGPSISK